MLNSGLNSQKPAEYVINTRVTNVRDFVQADTGMEKLENLRDWTASFVIPTLYVPHSISAVDERSEIHCTYPWITNNLLHIETYDLVHDDIIVQSASIKF
jgi:hypothetical protein